MYIHISPNDGLPIYLQIVNQVKYLVASGRLQPGAELPPIRVLADRLVINPNTVARAYRELEHEGVLELKHGSGAYIKESAGGRAGVMRKAQALMQSALERLAPSDPGR